MTVGHAHKRHLLFTQSHTRRGEFSNGTNRCRFRCLTACVRVNLCVQNQNVYVFIFCHNMIQTTVSDVVGPSIATENPNGFVDKVVLNFIQFFQQCFFVGIAFAFQSRVKGSCDCFLCCNGIFTLVIKQGKRCFKGILKFLSCPHFDNLSSN